ncbi:MAG: Crp/Fnr family transcriptional regulator [Epsilonproteobacteria bacterium]|nr:Crp/Fnr family transcriptional regulator [Campylobacterota bacterium]
MINLQQCYMFEHLNEEQLKKLGSFANTKHYTKGSIVFYEGEMPTSLMILVDGMLKIYKTDKKNNEIILHMFKPTSMIAEMAILEGVAFPASGAFETDGILVTIDMEMFKKEFLTDPDIALIFFKSLSKKIKYLENVIALNIVLDATSRLAKFLYDHAENKTEIKHYQLAEHLHMTPETLSRTFKKLVTLGLLDKNSHGYFIKNKEGLRVLFKQ